MRIAVTGATGFIGKYLVRRLVKDGHDVRVLCRPGRESALELPADSPVEVQVGDLTDAASLEGFANEADFLVHLASAHDHFEESHMQLVNVKGTENLVDEVRKNGPKHLVFVVVSSAVIGVPVYSYYRDSKRVQEKIVRGAVPNWASFRPTLVYGKGDYRHTAPLLRKCGAQKGSYWIYHEGVSMLNPVHIDDLIEALMLFFAHPAAQETRVRDCRSRGHRLQRLRRLHHRSHRRQGQTSQHRTPLGEPRPFPQGTLQGRHQGTARRGILLPAPRP